MDKRTMKQRSDSQLQKRVERAAEYLRLRAASANPDADFPATVEALAAFIPCARRLLYKTDAETTHIREALRAAAQDQLVQAGPPQAVDRVPVIALDARVDRALATATTAARRFIEGRREDAGTHAAALAASDLDLLVRTLLAAQAELKPLVAELGRRRTAERLRHTEAPLQIEEAPRLDFGP